MGPNTSTKEDQNIVQKEQNCSENWKDRKKSHLVLTTAKYITTFRSYFLYLKLGYFAAREVRGRAPGEKTKRNLSVQPGSMSVAFLLSVCIMQAAAETQKSCKHREREVGFCLLPEFVSHWVGVSDLSRDVNGRWLGPLLWVHKLKGLKSFDSTTSINSDTYWVL